MPHHHTTFLFIYFFRSLNQAWYFFTTCHEKNASHEIYLFQVSSTKSFGTIHHHYMCMSISTFVHDTSMYIHIIYNNACIHQGLNPRLHVNTPMF
jgi:hypothetical protein